MSATVTDLLASDLPLHFRFPFRSETTDQTATSSTQVARFERNEHPHVRRGDADRDQGGLTVVNATVTDLLARRERHHQPRLHFADDWQALTYTADLLDRLRDHLDDGPPDTDRMRLELAQAAAVVRACMRVHRPPGQEQDNR